MMKLHHQRAMVEDVHSLFQLGAMGAWADGKLVSHFLSGQAGCDGAFRVLLHRHGPMVLSVCRRILGDSHAAEDAFQATFLVLVKKAGSIRDHGVLTGWLYGVALRVARKAKSQAARRQVVESRAAERSGGAEEDHDRAEVRTLIHEEIARLPERYREPLVLCYLEGLRHHEIAERLECPVGTVESRLSRGRERLRSRLERRGLAPTTASGPGLMLLARDVPSAIPASLVESTIRGATGFAFRRIGVEVAATSAASLAKASSGSHFGHSLAGLAACLGVFAAGFAVYQSGSSGAGSQPSVVALAAEEDPSGSSTAPARKRRPDPPPIPSRPDSANAVPLGPIEVDGQLGDWPEGLVRHPIRKRLVGVANHDSTSTGLDAVPEAYFRVGYNAEAGLVYVAVEVEDEDVVASPVDPWHTDAVEVYVDGLFTKRSLTEWEGNASKLPVVQYAGVPGRMGAYGDAKSNPALMFGKISDTTTKMAHARVGNITTYEWSVQVFDHFPDRPTRLEPGKRIGFDVVVVDKDRDRPKSTWLYWGPTWTGFKTLDASSVGELILVEAP